MRRAPAAAAPIPVDDYDRTSHRRDQCGATRCATPSCVTNARTSVWRPAHQPPGAWPSPRPQPTPTTGRRDDVAAATPASRSFVLASLRALHLDPEAPTPAQRAAKPRTSGPARPTPQPTTQPTPLTNRSTSVLAVAHNVDDVAIWVTHEEPPNAPRFERQRVDDLIATALRLGVGVFDAIADVH